MINLFYKFILQTGVISLSKKKQYICEMTQNIFIKNNKITINTEAILNINFLFYSLFYFVNWSRFIWIYNLNIWFIINENDINFIKYFFIKKIFNFISAQSWIAGLICNPFFVMKGERFNFALNEHKIEIKNWLQVAFVCSTNNIAILQEMNYCLIPCIAPALNIEISDFTNLVPLFLPENNDVNNKIFNTQIQKIFKIKKIMNNTLISYTLDSQRLWLPYLLFFTIYSPSKC